MEYMKKRNPYAGSLTRIQRDFPLMLKRIEEMEQALDRALILTAFIRCGYPDTVTSAHIYNKAVETESIIRAICDAS